jgi:ATP-binding cassette subfamily B multidrug efflux pump
MSFTFSPAGMHGPGHMLHHYQDVTGKIFDKDIAGKMLRYLVPHRRRVIEALVWMIVGAGTALLAPYLIKTAIDDYISVGNLPGLAWIALAILGSYALDFLTGWRRRLLLQVTGHQVLRTMRGQLFRHYQILSMSYFDQNGVGTLISRMLSDVGVINELLSQGLVNMLSDVLILVSTTIVMLVMDARLALLTLSVLPVVVLVTAWFAGRARVAYRSTREKISALTGRLAEDIGAMRVIQAFSEENRTSRDFEVINRENRDANVQAIALASVFTPTLEILSVVATGIILWFGGRTVVQGAITLGLLVAFISYTARLFQPILDLSMVFNTFQAAMAGGERILEILEMAPDIQDKMDALVLPPAKGHIEFEHVDFAYLPSVPVLTDINFELMPGENVALVGPTGAGKTTITSLLIRYYEITGGSIRIDGHDIREISTTSLRQQLGVVPQDPFLFQGSIAYNISFGRPEASMEEIIAAAKAANAHDFVVRLPKGYDTEILEGSANLSLGQRQLVCLARVILAQPRILVLDEATSSVDLRTEGLIQDALEKLMAGRTSLIIAHRLATVQRVHTILVIDEGRIVERGSHEELLALGGVYAHLYQTQFLNVEPVTEMAS